MHYFAYVCQESWFCLCLYEFSIEIWNCSDSAVFCPIVLLNIPLKILQDNDLSSILLHLKYKQHLIIFYLSLIKLLISGVLMPLSAIFQLYHGDQFQWWKKPECPERTTGQAIGKLCHLRLRVEYTLFVIDDRLV